MARKKHPAEEIVAKLRQVDVLIALELLRYLNSRTRQPPYGRGEIFAQITREITRENVSVLK